MILPNDIMSLKELVYKTRTCRRFVESFEVDMEILRGLVDLARMSASAGNKQPLKYLIYNTTGDCQRVFQYLAWAAYLENWAGPASGERPSAYIIILGDRSITESFNADPGISAQTMMLGATEAGLAGCIIASVNREALRNEFSIPGHLDIILVLALGKPAETVVVEEMVDNDIKYWRDNVDVHHVPKRKLDELILEL